MPSGKNKTRNRDTKALKCGLPPKEALKRAMLVAVPDYWKRPKGQAKK